MISHKLRRLYSRFRDAGASAASAWSMACTVDRFAGLEDVNVRIVAVPETDNYFDVYGEPDDPKEKQSIVDAIERDGCWVASSQWRASEDDEWETVDSIGMCVYADPTDPFDNWYVPDLMNAALNRCISFAG